MIARFVRKQSNRIVAACSAADWQQDRLEEVFNAAYSACMRQDKRYPDLLYDQVLSRVSLVMATRRREAQNV
jgi:hypothetical protein